MDDVLRPIKKWLDKRMALETTLTLYDWDEQTLAPCLAMENTGRIVGILSEELYKCMVNDDIKNFLEKWKDGVNEKYSYKLQYIIWKIGKDYEDNKKIPVDEYRKFSMIKASANSVWENAKNNNDFSMFAPTLKEIIDYTKKFASYKKNDGQSLYDVLLDDYELGFNEKKLDDFFELIKKEIVPLAKKKINESDSFDKSYNYRFYPAKEQEQFCNYLAGYLGFDFDRGIIARSEHPFTTSLHNKDVRMTNHYYENDLEDSIFSCIHETGHALYEQNIPDELTQTLAGVLPYMGIHESQSRFYENVIGRSKEFWEPLYGKLVNTFKKNLEDVSLDTFINGINKVNPTPIRTSADELTYPVHILIRYELEKKIINEDVDVNKLKDLWNEKYEEYLGIKPENDAQSILQDVHWSCGNFGYFPSYALGNAFAAQIYYSMEKEFDVKKELAKGNISRINMYLCENVHKYGATISTDEILKRISGEEFNPDFYIRYLKEKFEDSNCKKC